MELRESIESINYKLERNYGRAFNNNPNFRVVFSDNQIEKRWTQNTKDGLELLFPEVKELPKYRQWVKQRYILERLVPIVGDTDLTVEINYEPCWVFQDNKGEYLPPWFEGCCLIIESLFEAAGKKGHAKYKDPNTAPEERMKKLENMEAELFGNETDVSDAMAYGSGVSLEGFTVDKGESATVSPTEEQTKKDVVN